MKLIVGLGNPGEKFALSRHNIGFLVIDRLASIHGIALTQRRYKSRWGRGEISGQRVILAKPYTFMNLSGEAVKKFLKGFELSLHQLMVIHDDLDLACGRIKIKKKGGDGGHRGIQSIIEGVGGGDFTRVRVGIGRPLEDTDATDYVLQPFDDTQRGVVREVVSKAQGAVELLLEAGIETVMNRYNRKR